MLIGIIGLITAFLAGTMALVQNDVKKVLAYSTISQLGFMFLACSVGAFDTALFHVVTHAFFKALLFLAAGSVIHACHGEQDMKKMGGLKFVIPQTFWLMTIGALALAGIIPFAGFFSKDEILYSSLALPMGHLSFYLVAQLIAILTAFYTARMIALVFLGESRMSQKLKSQVHESPLVMLIPLYILAFCTVLGGVLGLPHYLSNSLGHVPPILKSWLTTIVPIAELPESALGLSEGAVSFISGIFAILFFWLGIKYFTKNVKSEKNNKWMPISSVVEKLYYENFIVSWLVLKPFFWFSKLLLTFFENSFLQKLPFFLGVTTKFSSRRLSQYHNGNLHFYTFCLGLGLMLLFIYCGLMIF